MGSLVINAAQLTTSRGTVPKNDHLVNSVVCTSQKVSDIVMLDRLEGGLVTESKGGLAVMF